MLFNLEDFPKIIDFIDENSGELPRPKGRGFLLH